MTQHGGQVSGSTRLIAAIIMAATALAGCGSGTRLVKDPEPLQSTQVLASACDEVICAYLDWVIVRNGPGAWAKYATWDEYLLRVVEQSDSPVVVNDIAVVDSLGYPQTSTSNRNELKRSSSKTIKRFRHQDLKVSAGDGTAGMVAAGFAAPIVGMQVGAAALYSSTAAVAGTALILVAPAALIAGGFVRGARANKVEEQIRSRATEFPLDIAAGQTALVDIFVAYAPSPQQVEISYSHAGTKQVLRVDTRTALAGLHFAEDRAD